MFLLMCNRKFGSRKFGVSRELRALEFKLQLLLSLTEPVLQGQVELDIGRLNKATLWMTCASRADPMTSSVRKPVCRHAHTSKSSRQWKSPFSGRCFPERKMRDKFQGPHRGCRKGCVDVNFDLALTRRKWIELASAARRADGLGGRG